MFYTGIITSLLPYILLIGVFGTLILNQAFHAPNKSEDPEPASYNWSDQNDEAAYEKAADYRMLSSGSDDQKPPDHPKLISPNDLCLKYKPSPIQRWYHQPSGKPGAVNKTFSLRGPPVI